MFAASLIDSFQFSSCLTFNISKTNEIQVSFLHGFNTHTWCVDETTKIFDTTMVVFKNVRNGFFVFYDDVKFKTTTWKSFHSEGISTNRSTTAWSWISAYTVHHNIKQEIGSARTCRKYYLQVLCMYLTGKTWGILLTEYMYMQGRWRWWVHVATAVVLTVQRGCKKYFG